jgi:hypothetical protein
MRFTWEIYGFNTGHSVSTISKHNIPFQTVLACNPYESNCALFREFAQSCPHILPSTASLLDHIRGSGDSGSINGYIIHSHRYQSSKPASAFWSIQASIVAQLCLIQHLNICIAFVHPDHNGCAVTKFCSQLKLLGWILSITKCFFPHYGDSVAGNLSLIVGVHDSTQSRVDPTLLRTPPSPRPRPLAGLIWQPFNKCKYSISLGKNNALFGEPSNNGMIAGVPSDLIIGSLSEGIKPMYFLHSQDSDAGIHAGAAVLSLESLCPPFDGLLNTNVFGSRFSIKFHAEGNTHIRAILAFKFTSCFGLMDHLQFCLSQHLHWYALDGGIPALTSARIFNHILDRLLLIRDSNTEIFSPNQFAPPAAHIQAFVNGVIATCLPDHNRWIQAIASDPELSRIKNIIANPSTLSNAALAEINYNYHSVL